MKINTERNLIEQTLVNTVWGIICSLGLYFKKCKPWKIYREQPFLGLEIKYEPLPKVASIYARNELDILGFHTCNFLKLL